MKNDEVTYSDIVIMKTENGSQKQSIEKHSDEEGTSVIYSRVNVLKKGPAIELNPLSDSGDFSAPTTANPVDIPPKSYSGKESHPCISLKCTVLLLFVCVLLLAIAVTVGGLYIMEDQNYSVMKENLKTLKVQYSDISKEKKNVEIQLSETEGRLSDQKNRNDNLTRQVIKLKTELKAKKCAVGWQYFDGSCYYFSTDQRNWTKSRDACVTMGGHLVIIESAEEMDFLKDVVPNVTMTEKRFWIGLTQEQQEGRWYWLDDTTFRNLTFWSPNNPNDWQGDGPGGEDCGLITPEGEWNDGGCHIELKRICETKSCSR